MRPSIASMAAIFILAAAGMAAAQNADQAGSKDHPLFTRMPNHFIWSYEASEFDEHRFDNGKGEKVAVEGRKTRIGYGIQREAKAAGKRPSFLAVRRNYTNAIQKAGGQVVAESSYSATLKMAKGGAEVWAEVMRESDDEFVLTIVEKGEMTQDVAASDILSALEKEGRVALYINFATGSATIQPDGQPIIDQIAASLQKSPALSISIEGHTDNVGGAPANLKLSQARAQAVVSALVAKGIASTRLTATGLGQTKPLADNATEDGRAKNRRVELVKK